MLGRPGRLRIVSIHWGFSLGGVAKYAELLEGVGSYAPITLKSLCIIADGWRSDQKTLGNIDAEVIRIRARLDPSWIWRAAKLIDELNPQLLLTHGFNGHIVASILQKLPGQSRPIASSYHGLYHPTTWARVPMAGLYNAYTEHFLRYRVFGVAVVAGYCRDYLVAKGVSPRKIRVIHNGLPDCVVPATERARVRAEWEIGPREIVIGVASRLDPVKGISYLIDAFASLVDELDMLRLVIVGRGTLDAALRAQVRRLGVQKFVLFIGFRTDIDACLTGFDIFALPSLSEYHSIALLEAMRAGKAIVVTDVGGNTESVTNGCEALVVPVANTRALVDAVRKLVTDARLAAGLGRAARERFITTWTEEHTVRGTAEWLMGFEELTAGR